MKLVTINMSESIAVNKPIILILILLAFQVSVRADDQPASEFSESDLQTVNTSQYKKFNVKFDDEMVKGGTETPEAEFLFQKGDFNFKRLIRLRENFIPEVQKGKDYMRGLK